MMNKTAIIWLRRDLRLDDHFAFHKAQEIGAKILPVFIFDSEILKNFPDKHDKRISFIYDRLKFLNEELRQYSAKIEVFYGNAVNIIESLLLSLKPMYLIAGAGYEPYDLERDKIVKKICIDNGIEKFFCNDHLIYPPNTITKDDGSPFKVFTPYSKKLYKKLIADSIPNYGVSNLYMWNVTFTEFLQSKRLELHKVDESFDKIGYKQVEYKPWQCNFQKKDMSSFVNKIEKYKEKRDFLFVDGTSKFSPYLRFGFISIRDCLRMALSQEHSFAWINELIWRDFYAMALYFYPNIVNEEFLVKYRRLKWSQDQELFEKFVQGMTGFPVVDAAMRQLHQIGWVHNRARMIVANFLTKCLLIDWRLGEKLYAQKLMDYEMSSNIGGWQWAASTGFDAQPYFRIFNPELQGRKFDQYGEYVKKYLPEFSDVSHEDIFTPSNVRENIKYPEPIINYKDVKNYLLSFYKNIY